MRFSSIVALVVVTASFALAGCAADAEPAASNTDNIIHEGTSSDDGRASEVRLVANFGEEVPSHDLSDPAHLRVVPGREGNAVNPFVPPPSLDRGALVESKGLSPEQMEAVVDEHTRGTRQP